ncbi:sensor histidine kinase [Parenemella sanctibonifatiensis]|uniref:histidine kinase n=1 Tax=Parenemella sanctibonifatiensis TaxID=2016505 RepID=A0A255EMU7_9ACTN|nr:PAS domain-containing sensor histidine kinase [Parenemella sanctibonifatiensis]OYN90935.1 hypothetical protein CGZ91_05495 [Parenemella sanctibonifatiensis]
MAINMPEGSGSWVSKQQLAWLERLTEEWHLLADLSFSDLVLWVPEEDDNIFQAIAQVRPTTGPTALEDDAVGEEIGYDPEHLVTVAYQTGVICDTTDHQLQAGIPVDVAAIPIVRDSRVIAVVERHTNRMGIRATGALEDAYLETAQRLETMLWHGWFPPAQRTTRPSPRVGDGVITLGPTGDVSYASPNAVSIFRRMGLATDLIDENFFEIGLNATVLKEHTVQELQAAALADAELTVGNSAAQLRVLKLRGDDGRPVGSLVLCRDTTEVRRHERQLVTKDATIREIHHRVKNNLQTVAALLRLQSRRISSEEGRVALRSAMGRVASIAVVHEILSQNYDEIVAFDQVCDQILKMVGDVAATGGTVIGTRHASFGLVPGTVATSLSLVLTELCQNAVEHGLRQGDGVVDVHPHREPSWLTVEVLDRGTGLPDDFDLGSTSSLGLSIVKSLVSDLNGRFSLQSNDDGPGSCARIELPIPDLGDPTIGRITANGARTLTFQDLLDDTPDEEPMDDLGPDFPAE